MTAVLRCCSAVWSKRVRVKMNDIYHEKQVKELCALHALNNLFQSKVFNKSELDGICENLAPNSWLNPHKSVLGLGNYDINVILTALQLKGCEGIWFDKRKDPDKLNLPNIIGFILNIPSDYKIGILTIPFHRRHWIAIRQIEGQYYNLDSKNEFPQNLGDEASFIDYLRKELGNNDRELFVVVTQDVEKSQSWLLESIKDEVKERT
ncbi:UNVERIFIED_CONTAM: hypothetical protein PYX00_005191 [Menopon gallinae]|uniref:Josephin-2 n=1 Tax=Menopon gallinae TaxID=328185 RepID=A0AAW2HQE9_9NEOP